MLIGGMMRHTAGFSWGYNQVLYFKDKFPEEENTKLYLMFCPVIAGVSGATMGGFLTDLARKNPKLSGAKGYFVKFRFIAFYNCILKLNFQKFPIIINDFDFYKILRKPRGFDSVQSVWVYSLLFCS